MVNPSPLDAFRLMRSQAKRVEPKLNGSIHRGADFTSAHCLKAALVSFSSGPSEEQQDHSCDQLVGENWETWGDFNMHMNYFLSRILI